jgi:hypothetical protein
MGDQENRTPTPEDIVVRQARAWRDRDKAAIANRGDANKRAEYFARQQLREAVDMLEKKSGAGQ